MDIEKYLKNEPDNETILAYEEYGHHTQVLADGEAWLFFETEQEMYTHYCLTVGDDGSKINLYQGDVRVYACTCNPEGKILTENT